METQKSAPEVSDERLEAIVIDALKQFSQLKRVLIVHPDYSRHDFTDRLAPVIYRTLLNHGLERLDTLNASGTHRAMSPEELCTKLKLRPNSHPLLGTMYNHEFDNPAQLEVVGEIDAEFVKSKTKGQVNFPLAVKVNKLIKNNYDLIIAINGTVPHEGTGFSGGTKIFFPGISGPEVTGLFHWAAVLIGIPEIIGKLENPAREVVDRGTELIFNALSNTAVLSFNMVYSEDDKHNIVPRGLFSGIGLNGFKNALRSAAELSAQIHIVYIDEAKETVVQQMPLMYDEIWTAGKGSYKLQRPGVIAKGGEIIIYAPHIHCFHSNKRMDSLMRQIGYHGRDYVVDYCQRNPNFDKNVASHMINVRGIGQLINGVESFDFKVTLATAIPEEECLAVGLGYKDPNSLREKDFQGPGKLWVTDGGQWLYARR